MLVDIDGSTNVMYKQLVGLSPEGLLATSAYTGRAQVLAATSMPQYSLPSLSLYHV